MTVLRVTGEVIEWRGPAPYTFVALPDDAAQHVADLAPDVSYGWGVVPVQVELGASTWTTSLFPKDGGYLVPLRAKERRREVVDLGDVVSMTLTVGVR